MQQLQTVDSHTGGEPTRVILDCVIGLDGSTMAERRADFENRFDHIRRGVILEPRGSDVLVGALLTPPVNLGSDIGVIFFNDVGCLGMCGHGTIGVVETLRHLGRLRNDSVVIDTAVGTVSATRNSDGWVAFENVLSYVIKKDVLLRNVPGIGDVTGDIAFGGNWFFIVRAPTFQICLGQVAVLDGICWAIRKALKIQGCLGESGAEIDHVELFSDAKPVGADSMNYVQCPGGAYDRSPCGTGTSAKLAALHARGELAEGVEYRQASVTGSVFRGSVRQVKGGVIPTIAGQAFITGESTLFFEEKDPFAWGLKGTR